VDHDRKWHVVTTGPELLDAIARGRPEIEVRGTLGGLPMITLPPGVRLRGGTLQFGGRGVRLTRDNELDGVTVRTADHEVAVLNDTSVSDLGTLSLRDVRTTGQVLLVAEHAVRRGHVRVQGLNVTSADLRGREHRPRAFGVDVLPGAFTLWNRQTDPAVTITAELVGIRAGAPGTPVRGSGVLVGGAGIPDGDVGTLSVPILSTGEIHIDGGIAPGTPDLISGGVMVLPGARVTRVINEGPVTTSGQNDMGLDNSGGEVISWTATAPVTTRGPSGVGFVNFGAIDRLDVQAPIRTFGTGARGFNFYRGSLRHASFHSIATHGDGAVGVQVSEELPILEIAGDLTTSGNEGQSLVKGVQVTLKAIALSVQAGAHVGSVHVGGQVRTRGDDVLTVEIAGRLDRLDVAGGIIAEGRRSDGVHLGVHGPDLAELAVSTRGGTPVVRTARA
jgi:hypothetical protein